MKRRRLAQAEVLYTVPADPVAGQKVRAQHPCSPCGPRTTARTPPAPARRPRRRPKGARAPPRQPRQPDPRFQDASLLPAASAAPAAPAAPAPLSPRPRLGPRPGRRLTPNGANKGWCTPPALPPQLLMATQPTDHLLYPPTACSTTCSTAAMHPPGRDLLQTPTPPRCVAGMGCTAPRPSHLGCMNSTKHPPLPAAPCSGRDLLQPQLDRAARPARGAPARGVEPLAVEPLRQRARHALGPALHDAHGADRVGRHGLLRRPGRGAQVSAYASGDP
jgi:hypothetical protein